MIDAVLDTTVILHLYRKYQPATVWFKSKNRCVITSITWLEVMEGTTSKASQATCKNLLSQFECLYPSTVEQQWAMRQLEKFQFSHHMSKEDCLIASVAYSRQLSLFTHNLKDMSPLIGSLAKKPYE